MSQLRELDDMEQTLKLENRALQGNGFVLTTNMEYERKKS